MANPPDPRAPSRTLHWEAARAAVTAGVLAIAFGGAFHDAAAQTAVVAATVETDPVPHSGDAADDPCIWIHPTDPHLSTIIATDKQGGLAVYDLSGQQIQYLPDGRMNNVDVRYGFPLGPVRSDIVTASNRTDDTIAIYRVDVATRTLVNVAGETIHPSVSSVYGSAMYHSASTGKFYVFVSSQQGEVEQWELFDDGSGRVGGTHVRSLTVGGITEGCVADDERGDLYVAEEQVAIWRYGAEPGDGTARELVDTVGEHLTAGIEGLALYYTADGTGYLLASSQGSSEFVIYPREGHRECVGIFRIGGGQGIDAVSGTDGIEVTSVALGGAFPAGVFVAQDNDNPGGNQNFKLVGWGSIATAITPTLRIDTSWNPRGPDEDGDGYRRADDCNDADPNVNPRRPEITYNGKDDDCNLATPDDDLDGDGLGVANDCNDLDPGVSPCAFEVANNGVDDDCNPASGDDAAAPDPPAGLVGIIATDPGTALLLHFEEGAGSTTGDASAMLAVGTLGSLTVGDVKEPAWTAGRFGPGLTFDGVDDQVRVPSSDALRLAGSFTVEAWVKRQLPSAGDDVIVNKGADNSSPRNYRLSFVADGRLWFFWELADGTNRDTMSASTVLDTSWHHIACVYDQAAGENRIYIDGHLDARASRSGTPATTNDQLFIGTRHTSGSDAFAGSIDEVRISPFARYGVDFTPPHGPWVLGRARVAWSQSSAPDLAGYNVHRSARSGGPYARISTDLLSVEVYEDEPYAGVTRYYVVTAVDAVGNESGPSAEVAVGPTGGPMSGDSDGDGWFGAEDCNDADPAANPGEAELPGNGQDDDCSPATPDDDFDRDGELDSLDCAPSDPHVKREPLEVDGVAVQRLGTAARLAWPSQGPSAGEGTVYDFLGGALAHLSGDAGYARASCLGPTLPENRGCDALLDPAPGDGRYYLVRARNSCGRGTFGDSTQAPDPRDAIEGAETCP